jgi:hypothetical protein
MDKPQLSKQAFWDVDMDNIDYEKHAQFVIERILTHGNWDDFKVIVKYYGEERIKKEVVKTTSLGPKELNFCCVIYDLKPTDFNFIPKGIKFLPLRQNGSYYNN